MGGVVKGIGNFFGFGGKSRSRVPSYSGPSPEQAAADARAKAAEEAKRVREANEKSMAEMNKRLELVRNQKTDYSQGTLGGQKTGLSRGRSKLKEARAMAAKKTQIRLDPGAGQTGAGQVEV